jgi:hypothetical protein
MDYEVFDLKTETGSAAYRKVFNDFPSSKKDLYFDPDYLILHGTHPKTSVLGYHFYSGGHHYLYPFLLSRLDRIGRRKLLIEVADIESAYGYGGPIANCTDLDFLAGAHRAFSEWCRAQRIIAEFIRFHPLLGNDAWCDHEVDLSPDRETRSLNLSTFDRNNLPFDTKTRNMIKRAERSGVELETVSPTKNIREFEDLYERTLGRLSADPYYNFEPAYFENLARLIQTSGFLLAARLSGRWIAGAIFFQGTNWLHYHLSASDRDFRCPGVTNLILVRAAELGQSRGLSRLHLGGGRTRNADDSLLRFKSTMSSDSHQFWIGRRIFAPDLYQQIREIWAAEYPHLVEIKGQRLLAYHEKA